MTSAQPYTSAILLDSSTWAAGDVRVTWKRAVQAVIDTPMAVSNKGLRRPTESVGPHLHAT